MSAAGTRLPRLLLATVVALVVLVAGGWAARRAFARDGGDWVEVKRGDLTLEVEVSGTLKAIETSTLGPPPIDDMWDYKIAHLAPEGSEVKPGDVVLAFDTSELERRLEEKRAESAEAAMEIEKRQLDLSVKRRDDELQLAEAEARKRKAQLKVERPEELASAKELEQARLDVALAEEEVRYLGPKMQSESRAAAAETASFRERRDRADARVREIEDAIGKLSIQAPREGTVIYVSNWRDEKKKVGDSCWRGERVVEIPDLRRMQALGEVDEADAGKVALGQSVRIKLDAHPDVDYTGRVKSIWGTVQRKSWNNPLKVMRLDVDVDKTDTQRMRPGMRFTGAVETGRVPATLLVPMEAVFPTPDGPVAWKKTGLGVQAVHLTLGKRSARLVEVTSGLQEGDRISQRDLGGGGRNDS